MKIKTVAVHADDRFAFRASVTWVRDDGTEVIDDLDGAISLPSSAKWAGEAALGIALHTGLAMTILRQSAAKAMALGMRQEDYFFAVQNWDGAFVIS